MAGAKKRERSTAAERDADAMQVWTLRLPKSLIDRARPLAAADHRTVTAYMRLLIERALETAERDA